uniref:MTSS I-BAR domain containing 2 n=1 Tax=Apteryx owenii TaxID=8824 RepID=A0A8B9SAX4_APTOW
FQSSYPIWEDFNSKATKLHSQLRTTVLAAVAFLDAFQKVADMATNTRGATRDIGSALTRMCMRHRSIEAKLRQFTNALMESLINPLQDRIEDWKKTANQLDKDHAKGSGGRGRRQRRGGRKGDLQPQLDTALQDVNDMYLLLEETEKQAVRKALIEERGRFCTFITFLQPVVNGEITMLGEITHLQGIIDDLVVLTAEPHKLPPASEQVIKDLKGSDYSWSYQTPPSSPSSSSSRKSSMCSSVSGAKGGIAWPGGSQTCSPSSTYRYRSLAQPVNASTRLSSVSSHDSGFISQDAAYSKPPSPMPSDITSQVREEGAGVRLVVISTSLSCIASPFPRRIPGRWLRALLPARRCRWHRGPPGPQQQDWSKASPYDQPVVNTLQRRKDRVEHLREAEMASAAMGYPGISVEEAPRPRMSPATIHGEEVSPAASDLAMVLTRGLSLEHQKSSRDSLQYSSGYSTQTTTPSCSEDTIPSQGTGTTPGVATIRRTPSTKPSVRRTLSNAGPIPIRPPIVPVKTPTVPDSPSYTGPTRVGSEECVFYADDASPNTADFAKASPKRLSLPNTAWGSNVMEISVYPGAGQHLSAEEEEDQQLHSNRHSLTPTPPPAASMDPPAEDMLVAIRRGVRLRRTITNDRSAPRIL